MLYIGSASETDIVIHHTHQKVKYFKKPRNLGFAQNPHKFYKLSQKSATSQRSFNHWVQGSSPCASTKTNRRNLWFFYTFAVATRIRIFRFFYQKMGILRAILHKICTKSAQYNCLILLNLCKNTEK